MALYHVHVEVIAKGRSSGGAAGFARYIAREEPHTPGQRARYWDRDHGHEDLVAKGDGGLPAWAESGQHFWQMADLYERGGVKRPGTVARTYQVTLPRELSAEARLALAADIRAAFFDRFPNSWAVHNPTDRQGQDNPHLHLMHSERREVDTYVRGPEQWFSQAAGPRSDPARRGVGKDRSWQGPERLYELRAGVATLTNAALEREGHAIAVSHTSLKARAIERAPSVYTQWADKAQVDAERQVLHVYYHPWEQAHNWQRWQDQKQIDNIRDIGREAIVDHVRDRFWRQDLSPARSAERQASWLRELEREYARSTPQQDVTRDRARTTAPRQRLFAQGLDDTMHGGAQVRLDEREMRHG